MKPLVFLALLTTHVASVLGQNYQQLRDSAAHMREHQNYDAAFRLLSLGMERANGHPYHNDLYDAAALATLSGKPDTAFYFLYRLLDADEYDMVSCYAEADSEFTKLKRDPRWGQLMGETFKRKNDKNLRTMAVVASTIADGDTRQAFTDSALNVILANRCSPKELYERLRHFVQRPTAHTSFGRELQVFGVRINDSTYSFYHVQLPDHYDRNKSYPMLIVLHGAVLMNTSFPDPLTMKKYGFMDTTGMNQFFSRFGYSSGTIVVYPHANRQFNWMYPDDGFEMVPEIVKDCKRYFNVDDDRVFVAGHSNGATGALSYLLKDPSVFAGFYGFNANPRLRTGGTFLKNARNRSYFNVATDKDYYFPVSGHDTLMQIARSLGIDWQNHVYRNYPHWFPEFEGAMPAFAEMFKDMRTRRRNPFQKELYWQCDDVTHGVCDWVSIEELDTAGSSANWAMPPNFTATHWIDNMDTSKVHDTVITVFQFPRKWGAVHALYRKNHFDIQATGIKRLTLLISPEMVDMTKPIYIFVNGTLNKVQKVRYNRQWMVAHFKQNFDRGAIWVDRIALDLQ